MLLEFASLPSLLVEHQLQSPALVYISPDINNGSQKPPFCARLLPLSPSLVQRGSFRLTECLSRLQLHATERAESQS